MAWLSDTTIEAIDEYLIRQQASTPPPPPPAPEFTDYAAYDAGMLDAFSRDYIYEDGSFASGGGDTYGAGLMNPWEPGWQIPSGYQSDNVIDLRGYGQAGGGQSMGGDFLLGGAETDASGNYWDSAAQAWRDPASGMLWDASSGWYDQAKDWGPAIDEGYFQQQPTFDYDQYMADISRPRDLATGELVFDQFAPGVQDPQPQWQYDFGPWEDASYFDLTTPQASPLLSQVVDPSMVNEATLLTLEGLLGQGMYDPAIADQLGGLNLYDLETAVDSLTAQEQAGWDNAANIAQDRSYLQLTNPPMNPQEAAQEFLYDPPKIDPENIDTGGFGWLGAAAKFVNDYTLKPLGIDAGKLPGEVDKYILQPLDYYSEVGTDLGPTLARHLPGISEVSQALDVASTISRQLPGPDVPTIPSTRESLLNTRSDLTDYQGAVSDFRDRPFWQQMVAGTFYDPTSALPGIGYGDDVLGVMRMLRGNVDDLTQTARPYLDDIARTLDDELGAAQFGRTTPLKRGDVVRDAAGREFVVAKNFDGTINGWVTVLDETVEGGVKRVKRGMLDAAPIGVADEAAATIAATPTPVPHGYEQWTDEFGADVWYRGGVKGKELESPIFLTSDPRAAGEYAAMRGSKGRVGKYSVEISNPASPEDLERVVDEIGYDRVVARIQELTAFDGGNPLDAVYVPEVRTALQSQGFDGVKGWDILINDQIPVAIALDPAQIKSLTKATPAPVRPGAADTGIGAAPPPRVPPVGESLPGGWQPEFGAPNRAAGAFGRGLTEGGRTPVPGRGVTQLQPEPASWQLPSPTRFAGESEAHAIARKDFVDIFLAREEQLRRSGIAATEISEGRAGQYARMAAAWQAADNAGLAGREAVDFVDAKLAAGRLRETTADIPASVRPAVDSMYDTIKRAYPDRLWDRKAATDALTEALDSGALQPRQRQILEAVFGDRIPDVERIAAATGRAASEATTIPMDLGPLTREGAPPLIGERGLNLPERPVNPLEPSGPRAAIDLPRQRDQLMTDFTTADRAASEAERRAARVSKGEWEANRANARSNKPLTPDGKARQDELWQRKLANAPDQGAATTAMRLREQADALKRQLEDVQGQLQYPKGTGPRGGQGPEMRTIRDATPPGDLVLRPQSAADVNLGVVPNKGESRSVAAARRGTELESLRTRIPRGLVSALNLPRAVKSGFDLSASLRQGLPLGLSHPVQWATAFKAQARSWARQSAYDEVVASIRAAPLAKLREKSGLFLASSFDGNLAAKEEAFMTNWASFGKGRIGAANLLKKSERGYVAMLDKLRADVFDSTVERWLKQGHVPKDDELRSLAAWINHSTGRGTGTALDKLGEYGSIAFFSPRYWASRPQMFADLVLADGAARKEVAKGLAAWVGGFTTLGAVAYVAGAEVGVNPLAGNFGKLSTGGYTFDLMNGLSGDIRTLARAVTGQRETSYGERVSAAREATIGRYVRGKLSPTAALLYNVITGKDYEDDDITLRGELVNTFSNLFIQDVTAAARKEFGNGLTPTEALRLAAVTTLAFFGNSGQPDYVSNIDKLNTISRQSYGKDFFDLTSDERTKLTNTNETADALWEEWKADNLADALENVSPDDLRTIDFDRREREMKRIERERTINQQLAWTQYQEALAAAKPEQRMQLAAEFRETIGDIQNNAAMEKRGVDAAFRLFKDTGEIPTDPKERAKVEYYDLFDQPGMKGPSGKLDGEAFAAAYEKLVSGWSAEQRAYVENEVRGQQYNIPEVQQMYADQKAIADSGYFDLTEGKREWRAANPEIAALIRKWGYSPTSILAEDVTNEYAAQQAYDDANLRSAANPTGTLSPEEWRDNYRTRMDKLTAAKDIIYRGLEEDGEATTAIDQWFRQIDASELPNGEVDWDAVDQWLAQQPAAMQAEIDAYTGTALTPQVAEYRAGMKAASGYFDLKDKAWNETVRLIPELAAFKDLNAFKDSATQWAVGEYVKQGVPWAIAQERAEQVVANAPFFDRYNKAYKEAILYPWIEQNPEQAYFMVEYGYLQPDNDVKVWLARWGAANGK